MKKNSIDKQNEVIKLLEKQKIRDVKDLESYKLSVCHPFSAGIDLGSEELYVALSPEIAAELDIPIVHSFDTFTSDLLRCRDLLTSCGINTVSMESTSVYWSTIYDVLRSAGIEVCLVKLYQILGADLSRLPGIRSLATLQIISEVGTDMSKFPTANHFASYLGFVPHNKITGGRIISSRTDRIKNSAAQAFRKLIPSISKTKTALGAFYRRLAPRIGKPQAITATCRKLAILVYNALVLGQAYIEQGEMQYLEKQKAWERKKLVKLAEKYNCQLIPTG